MARVISLGFAKPDDPIYKEGWSIHIGPLYGSELNKLPTPPVVEAAKKNNAATASAGKAKRRRKR